MRASMPAWRALGILWLRIVRAVPPFPVLRPQLLDRLAQIVAVGWVELPIAGEARAWRRFRGQPAGGAARQNGNQSSGAQWSGASSE